MPLNPAGYPLDLTGIAPSNFITNEVHVINTPRDRLFVPGGGPFYHIGFSIRNSSNNQLLLPNTDYKLLHLHKPAARDSGKDVYTVVYIINETVNSVTIDYHVVGGIHGETADVIRTLLESFPLPDDGDSVAWGQIIGIPTQFTPAEHVHHIDEIYNFNDVVSVLEQLRIAILAGDGPAINAIYQYFHQYLTNADYVTRDELLAITSVVPFFEIKSFPDYDTLRNATTMINGAPGIYCCLGRDNMFDRNGRIFLWDINATAPHNGDTIVRPHIIPNDTVNGRFISFQRVEKDLNLLASSLQRSINFDGTIEDGIINNGRVVLVDADNYLRDGTYWVGDANTIANVPFSWCVMKVDNIVVASNSTNGEVVQTFYNGRGDKATRSRYYDIPSGNYIWGPIYWYARREGDAAINFNVKDATQYDHAVNLRQLTSYGGNSTVQFLVSDATQYDHAVNLRQLTSYGGNSTVQFLVSDATQPDHAVTLKQLQEYTDTCHLGIVVDYFGVQSLIMPCFIGEKEEYGFNPIIVKVFISGAYKYISLYDIEPLEAPTSNIVGLDSRRKYIYLEEYSTNTFRLIYADHNVKPSFYPQDSMADRKRLYYPGTNPDTSSRLFLGIAVLKDFTWVATRSWFQDTGFLRNYQSFAHNGSLQEIPLPAALSGGFTGKSKRLQIMERLTHYGVTGHVAENFLFNYAGPLLDWSVPLIIWQGETVTFTSNLLTTLVSTSTPKPVSFIHLVDVATNTQAISLYLKNMNGLGGDDNADITHLTTQEVYTSKNNDIDLQLELKGQTFNTDATVSIIPYVLTVTSYIEITLGNVKAFRDPIINNVDPSYFFPNLRVIVLNGLLFNINLKDYHDSIYGNGSTAGITVKFIVMPGCMVTSSSTASYAITNNDTWDPTAVIELEVRQGGFVSGRGGAGGRGGRAYRLATDPSNFFNYVGGLSTSPTSHVHGKKGGNAIRTLRPLIIRNAGWIGVGGGGGGATAGGIIFFNTAGSVSKIALGGNSGGGGWPFGPAGEISQITPVDGLANEYYLDTLDGYTAWHVPGNVGETAGGIADLTTLPSGGPSITRTNGSATISHGQAGSGSLPFITQPSTGGAGSNWSNVVSVQMGDAGNGGDDGDYAINASNGGSFTIIPSGGTLYGGVLN